MSTTLPHASTCLCDECVRRLVRQGYAVSLGASPRSLPSGESSGYRLILAVVGVLCAWFGLVYAAYRLLVRLEKWEQGRG